MLPGDFLLGDGVLDFFMICLREGSRQATGLIHFPQEAFDAENLSDDLSNRNNNSIVNNRLPLENNCDITNKIAAI
jgi:hypothetical protein